VPVVVLTGDAYTAEIAVAAGADDAIVTSEGIATALGPIHRAIERVDPSRQVDLGRFFHTADGLFVVFDADGGVVRSNPAFSRRLGWSPARLRDLPAERRFHADDLDAIRAGLGRAALGGTETLRARHATDDGFWRDIDWSLTGDAATGLVYAVGTDVTDAVRTVRALESSAQTDHLTGLANRLGVLTRLADRVAGQVETAVLYCDLDGFKAVNDGHGHAHGDRVLVAAAGRLATRVRANDLAGRIGGDEFVVVTTPGRGAEQLAARLIEGFVRPISIDGVHSHLGLSVGIAMAPPGSGDVDQVLGAADRAMYRAKQAGGGTWRMAEDA
jgi:diguanylate cyclase (GGDEF)-like protein/PAS domain S-box-containing protein